MLIDWFTVGAQIINFLVLVWLLKSFLYRPLLAAVEKREKGIRDSLESAERMKKQAERARAEFEQKNADFARQQQAYLEQAQRSAEAERLRLIEAARIQTASQQAKWKESLASEQEALRTSLVRDAQKEIIGIARQVLLDFANAELEEGMACRFVEQLRQLDERERRQLATAAQEMGGSAGVIQSSKPLPSIIRQQIQAILTETLGSRHPVRFETSEALPEGIVLTLGGQRLSWTLEDYLGTLQKRAAKHLTEEPKGEGN